MAGAMPPEPAPEHPDLIRARRRERRALFFALGVIAVFVGFSLFMFAAYTDFYWAGRIMRSDVLQGVQMEYNVGLVLMGLGAAVIVVGYVFWREG